MDFRDFWYVACLSRDLKKNRPRAVKLLDEWVVLFRGERGQAVAALDRCLHRNVQLSRGSVQNGRLRCAYHGWLYDDAGHVVEIPAHGACAVEGRSHQARTFATREVDGMIFVRLSDASVFDEPFRSPHYGESGWRTERRVNFFENNVTNCVENFIDVPHTVHVHPGIFRKRRNQHIHVDVELSDGSVSVVYENETTNVGLFSRFLNPRGKKIEHVDRFHMPNITSVEYRFAENSRLHITSQSVPVSGDETMVYTDLTYKFGLWTPFSRPFMRALGQRVIDQDVAILANQMDTIKKYGCRFRNSRPDIVHLFIQNVRNMIDQGKDPREIEDKSTSFDMWI